MDLLSSAESAGSWTGAQGEVAILRFGNFAAYVRMTGNVEQPAGRVIEVALESVFRSSQGVHTFWDLRDLVSYHSDVRVCSTNVMVAHRKLLRSVHALTTSKIVAMGVSVANLALGGIVTHYKSAQEFERAVRAVLSR